MPSREQLMAIHAELVAKKQQFDRLRRQAAETGNAAVFDQAENLAEEIKAGISELSEKVNPFETELRLREQYRSQTEILKQAGLVKELPNNPNQLGFVGIDSQEYSLPSYEDIVKRLTNGPDRVWKKSDNSEETISSKEFYKRKTMQGFGKMIIVPFGLPIDTFHERYREQLQQHFSQGKLYRTAKDANTKPEKITKINDEGPLWVWDDYKKADINNALVYNPKQFDQVNHGGQTKQEILNQQNQTNHPFKGFKVIFLETDIANIPAKGKTIGDRPQLDSTGSSISEYIEKDKDGDPKIPSPDEFLKAIQNSPHYTGEQGMTPEDDIAFALTHLHETNQVVDDFQGHGKISYNTGAYFPSSGFVPDSCWYSDFAQASSDRYDPGSRGGDCGVRSAAGVE